MNKKALHFFVGCFYFGVLVPPPIMQNKKITPYFHRVLSSMACWEGQLAGFAACAACA